MLALSGQQEILGYEMDPFYDKYVSFIQARFDWFLQPDDLPITQRLYWLLILFRTTDPDPKKMLLYCEQVI